ncbi:hypothetical protein FH972_024203 [Carpinus fangiana]|uniref:Uncharacterized protein n=1 Tax=Carpinus fangiana TaxID=176857 RepID=A0A5N6KXN8_9ROSI|nr:hypothetical protein FH972_024203 [Carpinus fangiana]
MGMSWTYKTTSICIFVLLLAFALPLAVPSYSMVLVPQITRAFNRSFQTVQQYTGHRLSRPHISAYSTMSSAANHAATQEASGVAETQNEKQTLQLPGPGEGESITLDVSTGQSVTLDHLGPMVVNADGSLSRINNWAEMSEVERKNTMRIIGKRNKQRLEALKGQEE